MKILLRTISLVAIPLCSSAHVTVSEADNAPRIGDRLEYVLQSFEGPLSESVGDIGMMGGPLVVDVRCGDEVSSGLGDPQLGLAIVKHIVQLHGGTVWCESVAGQGARFFFTLSTSLGED